ncbi:hypothetical protein M1615_02940 [Patescibacteria group bacterium]|nr:hypothetical protein [Patescibacteria group bacterium]
MAYYSVEVGRRGKVPNKGEYPTSEDFFQASRIGVEPDQAQVESALRAFQSGYLNPSAEKFTGQSQPIEVFNEGQKNS